MLFALDLGVISLFARMLSGQTLFLERYMKKLLTLFAFTLTFNTALFAQDDEFAPANYEFYEETRSHDYTEAIVAQSKVTRADFSNERFVASPESDHWKELTNMWRQNEVDPLWASEQVLKEKL